MLGLPPQAAQFDCRITRMRTRMPVLIKRKDFTEGSVIDRKFVPKDSTYTEVWTNWIPQMTTAQRVTAATVARPDTLFGAYGLNWISNLINSFGHTPTFDGNVLTLLSEWSRVRFTAVGDQVEMDWITFDNAMQTGVDLRVAIVEEGITWVNLPGVPPRTQKRIFRSSPKFFSMTYEQVEATFGITVDEYVEMARSTYYGQKANPDQFILNIATDVDVLSFGEESQYKGTTYINGRDIRTFNYRNLITSFDKLCPTAVSSWRLFNILPTTPTIVGTHVKMPVAADGVVTVVQGDFDTADAQTATFTYDVNSGIDPEMIYYTEFGTTGKNENWGSKIDLQTGIDATWQ